MTTDELAIHGQFVNGFHSVAASRGDATTNTRSQGFLHAIRGAAHHHPMIFTALLTCSDGDCDEAGAFVGSLEAAESVLCPGCGCLMQIVGVEGGHEHVAPVIDLAERRARRAGAPGVVAA